MTTTCNLGLFNKLTMKPMRFFLKLREHEVPHFSYTTIISWHASLATIKNIIEKKSGITVRRFASRSGDKYFIRRRVILNGPFWDFSAMWPFSDLSFWKKLVLPRVLCFFFPVFIWAENGFWAKKISFGYFCHYATKTEKIFHLKGLYFLAGAFLKKRVD